MFKLLMFRDIIEHQLILQVNKPVNTGKHVPENW